MKYTPPIGGAANDPYVDANPATGVEGSPVPAAAIEHHQREIVNVITGAGLTPDVGDLTQLRQAIQKMITGSPVIIEPAVFAPAVVTGNAVYWDAVNSRFDQALADGTAKQNAVGFADVANGAVYAFGPAALFAGLTPGPYYLSGATAGAITTAAPANVLFVGIAKSATEMFVDIDVVGGITQAQADARYAALAGLATQLFSVASATGASHAVNLGQFVNSFAASGYAKLPGGFVLQWGTTSIPVSGASATFPIAFPTACFGIVFGLSGTGSGGTVPGYTATVTTATFTNSGADATRSWFWIAIGN